MAEKYYNKAIKAGYKRTEDDDIYVACLYNETGRKEVALTILNNLIKRDENPLEEGTRFGSIKILTLAAAYAMKDENNKALSFLRELEKLGNNYRPISLRSFPGFDKLRDNPEFKAILKHMEDEKTIVRARVKEMEQRGELIL
jgi:hypothetical protein